MKDIINTYIPEWLKHYYRIIKNLPELNKELRFVKNKIQQFSSTYVLNKQTSLADMLVTSHVLEKGITMPERRMGFGYDRVRDIIKRCNLIIKKWGANHVEVQAALIDLKQYLDIHRDANFDLPDDIRNKIEELVTKITIDDENCFSITKEEYFKPSSDFYEFANSRHSVRWFADTPIDEDKLLSAIKLAQTAPSACNRQATRVKIISSPEAKDLCCSLQNGNRGFGNKANKWLLVTTDLYDWSQKIALSMGYIDAGIFTMNLLYSLHYYGFVACTLIANIDIRDFKKFQKGLRLPESEIPVVFIVVGNPTDTFMIPKSRRLHLENIIQRI